jgi:hypothetical protein
LATDYEDWAFEDFSGYIAADELYDGPFCVLSIVDGHSGRRLMYDVLTVDPCEEDIEALFLRFRSGLEQRGLALRGITTDGSNLYPSPCARIFPEAKHQLCRFHIIKDIVLTILSALAQVRRELRQQIPKLPRGRPTGRARQLNRKAKRIRKKISDLFENKGLFVKRELTAAKREKLKKITKGLPHLRTLREIMDEVYRLFDRRCRTATALAKLERLRKRVRRFKRLGKLLKKLENPNLEKALHFLDERLLPPTSNAVERGYRRYRKMQKHIYRARTREAIVGRIALDMLRDKYGVIRGRTLDALHGARRSRRTEHQRHLASRQ